MKSTKVKCMVCDKSFDPDDDLAHMNDCKSINTLLQPIYDMGLYVFVEEEGQ